MKHKTNKYKIIDFDKWAIKIAGCVSVGVQPGKKKTHPRYFKPLEI